MKSIIVLSLSWLGLFGAACGDDGPAAPVDSETLDTAEVDVAPETTPDSDGSELVDAEVEAEAIEETSVETIEEATPEVYGPSTPPTGEVPEALRGEYWVEHYRADVMPFWTMPAALGTPVGNFPTYRAMNGLVTGSTRRRPRMIARQIFGYSAGYMMTGDEALLAHADAGVTWLREHAIDRTDGRKVGGCFPELDAEGKGVDGVRTAQDQAYCMLGLAGWIFVTRDPAAEADLIAGRDLLFDPSAFWKEDVGYMRDALDATLTTEVDVESDGGSELVAQLDPINAFLLLTQPVLSDEAARAQFLSDLRTLGEDIVARFHKDGHVWGVSNKLGVYGSKHADFGHSMKAVWMLLEIDKRLPDHPFHDFVVSVADPLVARAFDGDNGRWAKRPTSASAVEYGSDWWIYAEADQLAATLNLTDARHDDLLVQTQAHWVSDFVDRDRGEVVPGIKRDGSWAWNWPNGDTAKCNEWKNAYHSSEHALVLSILGRQREGAEVVLHFAVDPDDAATFIARPYIFHGREVGRTPGDLVTVGSRTLREVEVRFRDIY